MSLALLMWLAGLPLAHATLPLETWPECGEPDRPDLCPPDLEDVWELLSYIPAHSRESIRPAELALGSGMAVDRALRVTTGDWSVTLGIIDSGVQWDDSDTLRKWRLNEAELPLPQDADGLDRGRYDFNGDGVFNIRDWEQDPRVTEDMGEPSADDKLDPSDLIAAFSDGVDDDGNGYPDDISGWDFFDDDNNAFGDLPGEYGSHGQGVAEGSAAEGGNGGRIGSCPTCSLLALRVGDTFIVDGDRVARALAYAADNQVEAVSLAVGSLSNGPVTEAAARYAFDQGVVLVAAAGDENAYHHNFPAVLPEALYMRAVRYNTPGSTGPVYSYFNTQNCNNFGPRLDLVAPSRVCATGAVTRAIGVAGLVQSAARQAGLELHAGEVHQLLKQNTDDVWLTAEEQATAKAYPSAEGWDPYTGYGRVDAEKAVSAVVEGRIPPWLRVESPPWFATIDTAVGAVPVEVTVGRERTGSADYTVEVGVGLDPRAWDRVAEGALDGGQTSTETLATLDLGAIEWTPVVGAEASETVVQRLERVNDNAVTVRVTVVDAAGNRGQQRRTFFLDDDPDALPGFPQELGGSGEASPQLADLDGDGVFEVILATGAGTVVVLDGASGAPVAGWPVSLPSVLETPDAPGWQTGAIPPTREVLLSTPAVGDLDGDGSPEVVAAGIGGTIMAWHADGAPVDGFPRVTLGRDRAEWGGSLYNFDQGVAASVVLGDLDDSGTLEVVVAGMDGRLYIFDHQGADWGPYPMEICEPALCGDEGFRIIASPALGDLDGDGDPDLVFGSNETPEGLYFVVHARDARTGASLPGWPVRGTGIIAYSVVLPMIGEGHPSSVSLADLDGDGDLEMADPVLLGQPVIRDHTGAILATALGSGADFGPDSNVNPGFTLGMLGFASNGAWADLDGDGALDLSMGVASLQFVLSLAGKDMVDFQQPVAAWSTAALEGGALPLLDSFPRQIEDLQLLSAPAVADVTGDGKPEVIVGSAGFLLHAWDADGQEAPGWPKFTGGWLLGSPAVGDIDGDGYLDVVATTREGRVFAWGTEGRADQDRSWPSFRHDPHNTGNHETPLATQAGPADAPPVGAPTAARGCCKDKEAPAEALLLVPLLGLGAWRRRSTPPPESGRNG